jgi:pseudouridine synthase
MELGEGRNRQIRRMMATLGHKVRKLRRVAMGPLKLTGLQPGQWRELTDRELNELRRAAGI